MIARSTDDGRTWSRAGRFAHPTRGLFTTELFAPREGELHAFLQTYGFGVWMTQLQSYRAVSRDGGKTWTGPHSIPGGIQGVWVNRGIVHSSGRWILPVSWAELIGEEWAEPSVGRSPTAGEVGERQLKQVELPTGDDTGLQYRLAVSGPTATIVTSAACCSRTTAGRPSGSAAIFAAGRTAG